METFNLYVGVEDGAEEEECVGRQEGTRRERGDGQEMMRLENSLLGSRNYMQLVLHLKHGRIYRASPSATF